MALLKPQKIWSRPALPAAHLPGTIYMGPLMFLAGLALTAWGGLSLMSALYLWPDDMAVTALGFLAAGLLLTLMGFFIWITGVIQKELRQSAYEAARRAGEVWIAPKKEAPGTEVRGGGSVTAD